MRDLPQTMAMQQLQGSGAGTPSDIHDLIAQLRTVALGHLAYSQVVEVLRNAFDHCAAIARIEEMNRKDAALAPEQDK